MADTAAQLMSSLRQATINGGAPLYLRLRRGIQEAVQNGTLLPGDALPSERDIAAGAEISRVTVRKAVEDLVKEGVLVQRHGSGTFVAPRPARVEQSLSRLTSFTEDMARRGMTLRSEWLGRGICAPSPDEIMVLGLAADELVARINRLRIVDDAPLAIERASLSAAILPEPQAVEHSLYAELERTGHKPVRAIQRISAINPTSSDAALLDVPEGTACLKIERISYLPSGKVVEYTRSIYRGETYDFVAELRLGNPNEGAAA